MFYGANQGTEQLTTLENNVVKLTFTNKGGRVTNAPLFKDNNVTTLVAIDKDKIYPTLIKPAVERLIGEAECDIAFITGVGETFPYVRTHTLLGEIDTDTPIVLVFPGEYRQNADGSTSLDILNIPSDANGGYYRATSVFDL